MISKKKVALNACEESSTTRLPMMVFWWLLLILLVLRKETVGIDLSNYNSIFNSISQSDWLTALGRSSEVGWSFMNKVVAMFTTDFRWIIVITAVLELWFVAKVYTKYSSDAIVTIALFINMPIFILLFSGLRQCIAISLGFLAFELTRKKKPVWFVIVIIVAMMFHISAFMLVFMYPLYHIKMTKKWLPLIILLLTVFWIFNQQIFIFLGHILSMYTKYDAEITYTGSYTMLILFIMFAVFSYVIPDESKLDGDTMGMRNFLLFSVALQMFAPLHNIAMRMNYYYIVFIPLLIPRIIQCRNYRWRQVALVARQIIVLFFIIYFFMIVSKENLLSTFPYKFFWQQ